MAVVRGANRLGPLLGRGQTAGGFDFVVEAPTGRHALQIVDDDQIQPLATLEPSGMGADARYRGISQIVNDGYTEVADAALELKLFVMLEALPLTSITSFIGIVLVIVFFTTSSDPGSLVIDTITAGGKTNAPVSQRVFWCSFEGLVAIALLLGGGLGSLQAMSVSTGFPFTNVLLLACYAIVKGLRDGL